MLRNLSRPAWLVILTGVVLVGVYAAMVVTFRASLRDEIRQTIIGRDASVLRPVALRQLAQRAAVNVSASDLLSAVLESAQQENMLAVAVFDEQAEPLHFAPASLLFAELPMDDYLRLLKGESISRYHAEFPLAAYFSGLPRSRTAPVLEVLLPLHGRDPADILGFAQYYIDARSLAGELARTDRRIHRYTWATLGIGVALIVAVLLGAYLRLRREQRLVLTRNAQLVRANFDLTLAVKASALGQITSHLIHSLQGPVAGLRAMVARRSGGEAGDWITAADYTGRMEATIQEAVALLGDASSHTAYELTGYELVESVRKRTAPIAADRGVQLAVSGGFDAGLDSHRGSILCLITTNLVQNGVEASAPGTHVAVNIRNENGTVVVRVADEGSGISDEVRAHLFEAGRTGRPDGTGLGLAISQLLAQQIGASLALESTRPGGTVFRLSVPISR